MTELLSRFHTKLSCDSNHVLLGDGPLFFYGGGFGQFPEKNPCISETVESKTVQGEP